MDEGGTATLWLPPTAKGIVLQTSRFRPLVEVWSRDYEAAVVMAALEDAGFHPLIECDPRGWMHFYGWPFGSSAPTTVLIPSEESAAAREFLESPCEPSWDEEEVARGFAGTMLSSRRWIYGLWFAQEALFLVSLLFSGVIEIIRLVRDPGQFGM